MEPRPARDRLHTRPGRELKILAVMLIVLVVGITCLYGKMAAHRLVVLNAFFLPIILSGYFLGRTSAGVLAVFSVLAVTIATVLLPVERVVYNSPLLMGLALAIWGGILGLAAIMVGTLCDELSMTVNQLQRAYLGVAEVLTKYLQGGNPHAKSQSVRVAEICLLIAEKMGFNRKEINDIRVAALLHDLENVEITTKVVSDAVNSLGSGSTKFTFLGAELLQSLGPVLEGAMPLLANQNDSLREYLNEEERLMPHEAPLGVRIILVARAYRDLTAGGQTPAQALGRLTRDASFRHDHSILDALESVLETPARQRSPELAEV